MIDLEVFEARLRTAAFFLEKKQDETEEHQDAESLLSSVPSNKNWNYFKPPVSKYPELELFQLSNVRNEIINPHNIRHSRPNFSKGERAALKELKSSNEGIKPRDMQGFYICFLFKPRRLCR